jgi:hypothetical protein
MEAMSRASLSQLTLLCQCPCVIPRNGSMECSQPYAMALDRALIMLTLPVAAVNLP